MTRTRLSSRTTAAGFTLIELLVAIGLAALMLTLINFIFNDTARAVSQGIALSDIIGNERGASQQFQFDAAAMIGPDADTDATVAANPDTEGGVLVIVNHMVNDTGGDGILDPLDDLNLDGVIDPEDGEPITATEGVPLRIGPTSREIRRLVRSDQLMFMRNRTNGAKTIYPLVPETTSTFGNNFENGGTEYVCDHVMVWYGHALRIFPDGTDPRAAFSGDFGQTGINEFANNWLLARQANFLVNGAIAPGLPTIHANSAQYNATIDGYAAGTTPDHLQGAATGTGDGRPFHGLTDVSNQVLGSTATGGSILEDLVSTGGTPAAYRTELYDYLFLAERLWANPAPMFDPADPSGFYSYNAWQYAQMHPVLINNVSDFIVEFAADVDLDGAIDKIDHDGLPDTPEIIVWYTHDVYANPPGVGFDINQPITYPLPTDAPGLAYRAAVYDDDSVIDAVANLDGAFVWRHDDEGGALTGDPNTQPSYWPYLIRIRYRVHDSRGRIESGVGQHGVWFEHIIKVNRP